MEVTYRTERGLRIPNLTIPQQEKRFLGKYAQLRKAFLKEHRRAEYTTLKDFTVSLSNAVRLSSLVPEDVLFVAESGIRTRKDIETLERCGADAVLIGETFMRAPDKEKMFDTLRGGTR